MRFTLSALLFSSALLAAPLALAAAPQGELSEPIVAMIPLVSANADKLGLNAEQKGKLEAWKAEAPAKRGAVEKEAAALRAKLREMIYSNAPQAEREAVAKQIGEIEAKLVLMRSGCADNLRSFLTPEQFAELVKLDQARQAALKPKN